MEKDELIELVKQLREETGFGMLDCKKAVLKCNGDMEKAKEWLIEWQRVSSLASLDTNRRIW